MSLLANVFPYIRLYTLRINRLSSSYALLLLVYHPDAISHYHTFIILFAHIRSILHIDIGNIKYSFLPETHKTLLRTFHFSYNNYMCKIDFYVKIGIRIKVYSKNGFFSRADVYVKVEIRALLHGVLFRRAATTIGTIDHFFSRLHTVSGYASG